MKQPICSVCGSKMDAEMCGNVVQWTCPNEDCLLWGTRWTQEQQVRDVADNSGAPVQNIPGEVTHDES